MDTNKVDGRGREVDGPAGKRGRVRRVAFWIVAGLVALLLLVALLPAYPLIVVNWLPDDAWLAVRSDHGPADLVHRLHSLSLSVLAWGMFLGIALQAHRPHRKLAPLLTALAVPVSIAAAEIMAGTYTVAGTAPFIIALVLAAALHPASRELIRMPRWDLPMLGLVALAAVPWVVYAVGNAHAVQAASPAWESEHLTFASALALLPVTWGIIGASDRPGWPYAAGAAAAAGGFVALQSVMFPEVISGLSGTWAAAALLWCLAFAGAAVYRCGRVSR